MEEKDKSIQVRYENETLWIAQKARSELFDAGQPAIAKHLKNIYKEKKLGKSVVSNKNSLNYKYIKENILKDKIK